MKVGLAFPSREITPTADAIRRWAHAAQAAGADYLSMADHVLGVDPAAQEDGWDRAWPHRGNTRRAPYNMNVAFQEAFVTLGFLAAVCDLELSTDVAVLPQRNTAVFAKQAAQVDVLTGGRLRLGVGVGWNAAEFASMGCAFEDRGARMEEQIELLRRLWTEPLVTFAGRFHELRAAGLQPLPVQRPIPIWIGGASPARGAERVRPLLERIGRLADGWTLDTGALPDDNTAAALDIVRGAATTAGRSVELGVSAYFYVPHLDDDERRRRAKAWAALGATHLTLYVEELGLTDSAATGDGLTRIVETTRDAVSSSATATKEDA